MLRSLALVLAVRILVWGCRSRTLLRAATSSSWSTTTPSTSPQVGQYYARSSATSIRPTSSMSACRTSSSSAGTTFAAFAIRSCVSASVPRSPPPRDLPRVAHGPAPISCRGRCGGTHGRHADPLHRADARRPDAHARRNSALVNPTESTSVDNYLRFWLARYLTSDVQLKFLERPTRWRTRA